MIVVDSIDKCIQLRHLTGAVSKSKNRQGTFIVIVDKTGNTRAYNTKYCTNSLVTAQENAASKGKLFNWPVTEGKP